MHVSAYLCNRRVNRIGMTPENAALPDPEDVWRGVQEGLPRHVVLTVADYVPGAASQTATLTWREVR